MRELQEGVTGINEQLECLMRPYRIMRGAVRLGKGWCKDGMGAIPYEMLESLPLGMIFAILYLVIILVSFVTSANANVSVMAGLATKNITLEDPTSAPNYQKIIWGVLAAAIAYIIATLIGIDGLKALNNVAGLVSIFIQVGIVASVIMLISKWQKYDKTGTYEKTE